MRAKLCRAAHPLELWLAAAAPHPPLAKKNKDKKRVQFWNCGEDHRELKIVRGLHSFDRLQPVRFGFKF
jgi:hypothetical protein